MPELPEVETIRIGLNQLLPGKKIFDVEFDNPKSFPNDPEQVKNYLINSQITSVKRRAKVLIINLSTDYSLVVHLKMTGQLVFVGGQDRFAAGHPNQSLINILPDRSTRVSLKFNEGQHQSQLFFNDQRKFGWMKLIPTTEIENIDFFKKLGPEPLEKLFTPDLLYERLMKRPKSRIKAALLDQSVLAGIGNIYADESLWGAKIHPQTLVSEIDKDRVKILHSEIQKVLNLSLKKGGSTDKNYVDAQGNKGSYLSFAQVFRRNGQPCSRCGNLIVKTRVAGRGTHVCLYCQVLRERVLKKK